jgi:hypothetical protein
MTGVFAGAIYLEGLTWFQGALPHSLQSLFQIMGSGIGLVVILMFLPGGVGSLIFKGRDRLLREFADRKGITVPSLIADSGVRDAMPTMPLAEVPPADTAAVGSGGNGASKRGGNGGNGGRPAKPARRPAKATTEAGAPDRGANG